MKKIGCQTIETVVQEREGVWVPSNMPYLVACEEEWTVAVAWSILLPWQITAAYSTMEANRALRVDSVIPVKELIIRAATEGDYLNPELLVDILAKEYFDWPSEKLLGKLEGSDIERDDFFRCDECNAVIFNRIHHLSQRSYCPECAVNLDVGKWVQNIQQRYDKQWLEELIECSRKAPLNLPEPRKYCRIQDETKAIVVKPASSLVEVHQVRTIRNTDIVTVVRRFLDISLVVSNKKPRSIMHSIRLHQQSGLGWKNTLILLQLTN